MFSASSSAFTHSSRLSPVSTYWPSQKRAPSGCSHFVWHPPDRVDTHVPSQSTWQSTLACAVQLPSQEASHLASQLAEGGVPVQWAPQSLWQRPLQVASQFESELSPHDAVQFPSQSA